MAQRDSGAFSLGGGDAVEFGEPTDQTELDEDREDREPRQPSERWKFWEDEIKASMNAEERFREEGRQAERDFFGEDDKAYTTKEYQQEQHRTNIIHSNIEILKPLVYSERPEPIARRRFAGDGQTTNDPTDRVAALAVQRLASYMLDTSGFDSAMELARDDWLVPGRGEVRVLYKAQMGSKPLINPMTGMPVMDPETGEQMMMPVKEREEIKVRHWPWSRTFFAASNTWDECRWVAFETPMSKAKVAKRFGEEIAEAMTYPIDGLKGDRNDTAKERTGWEPDSDQETSQTPSVTAHSQCIVFEFWDKENRRIVWWSPHYREDVLDQVDDPLGLEGFFNCPKPLLAVTKGGMLTPRPDTAFYRARADEIDQATQKLNGILKTISVSGAYPGKANEEVQKLLDGKNKMVPIEEWIAFTEKGGMDGLIAWLPLDTMIKAAQALVQMREQAKQQLFEISGISDIVRGASDPNETLGAQQIKGSYANIRLRDRQQKMARFALATIEIMVEMGVEHFDTKTIADICNIDLPMTDADLEMMMAQQQAAEIQYQQIATAAQQTGQKPPPPPTLPFYERTSWERVHAALRDDRNRKFSIDVETDSTMLADLEEDKKQRVEFLQAFTAMADGLIPLARNGTIEMKIVKELLLFAVRGFPKSRTLEGMISTLPDDMNTEPPEDPAVTVAKIKAESEKMLKEMDMKGDLAMQKDEQQHEMRMKGSEVMADAFMSQLEAAQQADKPQPQRAN